MRGRSLLVEFVGLPGAGKSALSALLAEALVSQGLEVHQPSHGLAHGISRSRRVALKSMHVLRELMVHPVAACKAVRDVAASRQPSLKDLAKMVFNWLLVVSLARRALRKPGVHLFDQGLVQGAWSIGLEGETHAALRLLAGGHYSDLPSDVLIVVGASLPELERRIRSRPESDSRLDRRLSQSPDLLQECQDLLDQVLAGVPGSGLLECSPRVIRLVNEVPSDLQDRIPELTDEIVQLARESGFCQARDPAAVGREP